MKCGKMNMELEIQKGVPLTPEETRKFWEELPAQMAEKYSDKNMKLVMDYLSPKS